LLKGIDNGANHLSDGMRWFGKNPLLSAGIGLGAGAAYDLGKRTFYNTEEENAEEDQDPMGRALRYVAPAAALGGGGALMNSLTPDYYKFAPTYNATNPASHVYTK